MISVVIMIYKNFDSVEKTLKSVLSQSYKDIEIIISDDCSPGLSYEMLERYLIKCQEKGVKAVINQNAINLGTVKHLNKIISLMSGEILCPLSAGDEFYGSDVLHKLATYFQSSGCLICTAQRIVLQDKKKKVVPTYKVLSLLDKPLMALNYMAIHGNFISGACTYYKRDMFEKYGKFDEQFRLMEDFPYYARYLYTGGIISYLEFPTIRYELGGVSTNKVRNTVYYKDYCDFWKLIKEKYMGQLNRFPRRCVKYRCDKYKAQSILNKIFVRIRYFDVFLYLGISNFIGERC